MQAVVFFCSCLLSPIASTFRSGVPYAARTFLFRALVVRQRQAGALPLISPIAAVWAVMVSNQRFEYVESDCKGNVFF